MKDKKGEITKEMLAWLIFFVLVIILVVAAIMIFTDAGTASLEVIKKAFRF